MSNGKTALKKSKLRKNDQVEVITGKAKGKTGRILKVDKDSGRVIIEGVNLVKKAMKPKKQGDKGGIIDIEAPLHISDVQILCKKCGKTRIGYLVENGEKARICKKCGEAL